jgi:hypothetical protein
VIRAVVRAPRRAAVPLAAYYGITIVVPLVNGSGGTDRAFLEHLSFVALFPLTLVGLSAMLLHAWRQLVAIGAKRLNWDRKSA